MTLHGRDFLAEADFTRAELDELLALAARLKAERRTRTNVRKLTKDVALMPSGLLGPVRLLHSASAR